MAKGKGKQMTEAQKAEKWIELAQSRFDKALKQIASLTKLANGRRYKWESEQIETMKEAFTQALDGMFAAYAGKATASGGVSLAKKK